MKMSHDYMRETAAALTAFGFALETTESDYGDGARGSRYVLRRERETLTFETVVHPTEGERYFLEIEAFHGLRTFSLPLDSWKHRPGRIEVKYYALPGTGRALSFTLALEAAR